MTRHERPTIIVVHGAPGAGKTTLARHLSQKLAMGLFCKDDVKELLFDTLQTRTRGESQVLGKQITIMMYHLIDGWLNLHKSMILESNFEPAFANIEFKRLVDAHPDAIFIQVHCIINEPTRTMRLHDRLSSGTRHPGHLDSMDPMTAITAQRHHKLALTPCLEFRDQTPDGTQQLVEHIRAITTHGSL